MNRLRLLGLWMLLMPLLAVASELDAGKWVAEDASGKFRMTTTDGVTEIVASDGLTLWYDERLTGNYEISYRNMLRDVVDNWKESFTPAEQAELEQLLAEVEAKRIRMEEYASGVYQGTRWFFNNDDLMKHTADYHLMVNMASVRCDGLESADFADNYNFYPTDGMTLFQRRGDEYFRIMGGWDVTASPGVTAREGMDRLVPVTNWRGYCSRHNFAAGAADGGDYAAGGYIFEKMYGPDKENPDYKGGHPKKNALLYGFKAYKGYFRDCRKKNKTL